MIKIGAHVRQLGHVNQEAINPMQFGKLSANVARIEICVNQICGGRHRSDPKCRANMSHFELQTKTCASHGMAPALYRDLDITKLQSAGHYKAAECRTAQTDF